MEIRKLEKPVWHSVYIYYNHINDYTNCLVEVIKPLVDLLTESKVLIGYFYIRYWEEGPHIRFRTRSSYDLGILISKYLEEQISIKKYLVRFKAVEYIPEIARYGGEKAILVAEQQFNFSSTTVLGILTTNLTSWDYNLAIGFAIKLHVNFAKGIGLSTEAATAFFRTIFYQWLSLASAKLKIDTQELINAIDRSFLKQKAKILASVKEIWEDNNPHQWREQNSEVLNKLLVLHVSNDLICPPDINSLFSDDQTKSLWGIFDSFCHMTNNRLGILNQDESYIYYVIYRSFKGLNEEQN